MNAQVRRVGWSFVSLTLLMTAAPSPTSAEVVRVEIRTRAAIGTSGYEKIIATAHIAVDPRAPQNQAIVDIDRVPTTAGRVELSADLFIIKPIDSARSNNVALVDVPNRGYPLILQHMNRAPGRLDFNVDADLGDGFLMRRGYTLVWIGWQFDLPRNGRLLGADLPRAISVDGVVRGEFTPNDANPTFTVTDLAGYPPADPAAGDAVLTVRDGPFGLESVVPRSRFELRRNVVTLTGGFEPGKTYVLSYRSKDPVVAGLGLAAVRDVTSWVRYHRDSVAPVRYVYGYGVSQSGRFLRTFLYEGLNRDERGRPVFDGVMAVGAGGARLSVNERWAQPNSNSFFSSAVFPFSDGRQQDPMSSRSEGLLERGGSTDSTVKVFHVNSAFEYWGGGREAGLTHTTPDGKNDVAPPANVRIYAFASAAHAPGPFPPQLTTGEQPANPVPFALRGLLMSLDRWCREGMEPPANRYPTFNEGTLVLADRLVFPPIPGVRQPRGVPAGRQGTSALPLLVSQVDEDVNERGGVRLPHIAVPLGTYTGWNFRSAAIGGAGELFPFMGSFIPFASTKAAREASHDPRKSIEERYASRDEYLQRIRLSAEELVRGGFLMTEEVPAIMENAEQLWELLVLPATRNGDR